MHIILTTFMYSYSDLMYVDEEQIKKTLLLFGMEKHHIDYIEGVRNYAQDKG